MKRHAMTLSALAGLAGAGCYNSAFVRNDGPVSGHGVVVALVGQRCEFSPDFNTEEETGGHPNRLDLGVRVSVQNDTGDTLTIQPESMRLVVGGVADAPVRPPGPVTVAPGATANVSLRFNHRGDLGCNASLSLALEKAVVDGSRPVELRALTFVPSPTES